jgi:hypothetical protein
LLSGGLLHRMQSGRQRETPGDDMADDKRADDVTEPGKAKPDTPRETPPAGPHARPELTNEEATPGSGMLPPADAGQGEVDPGSG